MRTDKPADNEIPDATAEFLTTEARRHGEEVARVRVRASIHMTADATLKAAADTNARNTVGQRKRRDMIEAEITERIIGAAIEVHRHWGPGLYEDINFNVPTLRQGIKRMVL